VIEMFSVGAIHPFYSPLDPPSNRIKSFGLRAFTPNPSALHPKQKNKFKRKESLSKQLI